jgi:hypothetical protein
MEKEITFEEIDKQMNSVDLSQFDKGGELYFSADEAKRLPADVLKKICAIYKVVRPILIAIAHFKLIPKKWREAIKAFGRLLDSICF